MLNFEKLFKLCEKRICYLKSNTDYLMSAYRYLMSAYRPSDVSIFFPKLVQMNFDFDLMFLFFPQWCKVKHNRLTKLIFGVLLDDVV